MIVTASERDELVEAAELLRFTADMTADDEDIDEEDRQLARAQERVAASLLRLLPPADTDEMVTSDWVKRVLPACGSPAPGSSQSALVKGKFAKLSWVEWACTDGGGAMLVYVGDHSIPHENMTRGEFRSLGKGMGVTLKEGV